jgi:hypothetical protein
MACRCFVENIVSALRSVFARHDITVSSSPIPRTLGPSTAAASQVPMTKNEYQITDMNPCTRPFEGTSPLLYVGPSSLGLTNLLMTHPTTPVRPALRSFARYLVDDPLPLSLQGPRIRPCDARGRASVRRDE